MVFGPAVKPPAVMVKSNAPGVEPAVVVALTNVKPSPITSAKAVVPPSVVPSKAVMAAT